MDMVKKIFVLLLVTNLVSIDAHLANATEAAKTSKLKVKLSPKELAERLLNKSPKALQINYKYKLYEFAPYQTLASYDWKIIAELGKEQDKNESFTFTNSQFDRLKSYATLSKQFTSGTLLGLGVSRTSQTASVFSSTTGAYTDSIGTLDTFDLSIEQSLLNNYFGIADRSLIDSSDKTLKSQMLLKSGELQTLVLNTIKLYWNTYVAQENFKESIQSKDRYQQLVDSVKRKTSLGYANPGELSQVQAELEVRIQNTKNSSLAYLKLLDELLTTLDYPSDTEIEFDVPNTIPAAPKLTEFPAENSRAYNAQKLKVEAASDTLEYTKSKSKPTLNLVAKITNTGFEETADRSFSELTSGTHPKQYVGLKFQYNFGSDYLDQDLINKKINYELEKTNLDLSLKTLKDSIAEAERSVLVNNEIVQSTQQTVKLREQTVKDLTRTFNQGRTDISLLIDSMNKLFATEVQLSRAIGDYFIALNEWAAIRDELIPENKGGNK